MDSQQAKARAIAFVATTQLPAQLQGLPRTILDPQRHPNLPGWWLVAVRFTLPQGANDAAMLVKVNEETGAAEWARRTSQSA